MKNIFFADLRGVDLTAEQSGRIEAQIQDIVLKELNTASRVGGKRAETNWALHIPKEWLGLWIHPQEQPAFFKIDDVKNFAKSPAGISR